MLPTTCMPHASGAQPHRRVLTVSLIARTPSARIAAGCAALSAAVCGSSVSRFQNVFLNSLLDRVCARLAADADMPPEPCADGRCSTRTLACLLAELRCNSVLDLTGSSGPCAPAATGTRPASTDVRTWLTACGARRAQHALCCIRARECGAAELLELVRVLLGADNTDPSRILAKGGLVVVHCYGPPTPRRKCTCCCAAHFDQSFAHVCGGTASHENASCCVACLIRALHGNARVEVCVLSAATDASASEAEVVLIVRSRGAERFRYGSTPASRVEFDAMAPWR